MRLQELNQIRNSFILLYTVFPQHLSSFVERAASLDTETLKTAVFPATGLHQGNLPRFLRMASNICKDLRGLRRRKVLPARVFYGFAPIRAWHMLQWLVMQEAADKKNFDIHFNNAATALFMRYADDMHSESAMQIIHHFKAQLLFGLFPKYIMLFVRFLAEHHPALVETPSTSYEDVKAILDRRADRNDTFCEDNLSLADWLYPISASSVRENQLRDREVTELLAEFAQSVSEHRSNFFTAWETLYAAYIKL